MTKPAVDRVQPPRALMRVVNPIARRLVARGLLGHEVLVLHFTGRRSGRPFDVPVGCRTVDGTRCVFTDRTWRHNFAGGRDVEVTHEGQRRAARAFLESDPDTVADAYFSLLAEHGLPWAKRHLGLRVHVDRPLTVEDLRAMIASSGLCMVRVRESG